MIIRFLSIFILLIQLAQNDVAGQSTPGISRLAHRYERYVLFKGCRVNGTYPLLDLVFVVDASESVEIGPFQKTIKFIKDSLSYFSIAPCHTRVALVTFSSEAKIEFDFDAYRNRECLSKALDRVKFIGRSSATGEGLQAAYVLLNSTLSSNRPHAQKMVVFLGDGYTDRGLDPIKVSQALKNDLNAQLFVIGVGFIAELFKEQLQALASIPLYRYFTVLPSVNYFDGIIQRCTHIPRQDTCCARFGESVYDECGRRCSCVGNKMVNCCRVRKEFSSMSPAERALYLQTYKTLTTMSPYKEKFQSFIDIHRSLFDSGIHDQSQFLPWHRWFMLELENMLQEIDCRVTVPYWAWSLWANDPWNTGVVWSSGNAGLGGNGFNGGCVTTGQFSQSQGQWSLPNGQCLERDFGGSLATEVDIAELLLLSIFSEFEIHLRINLHDNVHCQIGGTMCTIDSADAPEFFLHHGYVDKLWNDWQKKSTANQNAYFPSINGTMENTTYERKDLIDIQNQPGCVRVCYDEPSANNAQEIRTALRGSSMASLASIAEISSSSVPEAARKLFKTSEEEIAKSKEIESRLKQQNNLARLSLSGIEEVLGFQAPAHAVSQMYGRQVKDADDDEEQRWQKINPSNM